MVYNRYGLKTDKRDYTTDLAIGKQLEAGFFNVCVGKYSESKVHNVRDTRSDRPHGFISKLDEHEGTDFVIDGIRTDLTANAWGKDNLVLFCESDVTAFHMQGAEYKFILGIRTGNKHSAFKIPTVVLGVDCQDDAVIRANEDIIYESINSNIDELMAEIQDVWLDFNTTNLVEREEECIETKLKKNNDVIRTCKLTKETQVKLDFRNLIPEPHTDLDVGCEL